MRLLVHDFSGHPFQAQLSRSLAGRGNQVVHASCSDYVSGQGSLARQPGDPDSLSFEAISLGADFEKHRYGRRLVQEVIYGWHLIRLIRKVRPDVFVSCNEPLLTKALVGTYCRANRQAWVYWLQDLYSEAMTHELVRQLGRVGGLIGKGLGRLERWLLRSARGVVLISHDFDSWLADHRVEITNVDVIPNWAPLDELPYHSDHQGWFTRCGIPAGAPVALYSGTLGQKHDAAIFLALAERIEPTGGHVVVISQGRAADELAEEAARRANLHVLPFQPWADVASILGSATVLLAVLAPEAAAYSVPSKVLTYLCAGRPIVASVSTHNLAAHHIREADGGIVVEPDDLEGFGAAVEAIFTDPAEQVRLGKNARHWAEHTFDIERITDRFAAVIAVAGQPRRSA